MIEIIKKIIKAVDSFDNRRNSYIECRSKGDKYENLSPKDYVVLIRPYLKDMINDHKTSMRLPNNKTTSGEEKIQLIMLNNWISNKNFEEACARYSVSNNTEILIGSKIGDNIDELLNFFYKDFKMQKKNQIIEQANLFLKMLNWCIIIFIKQPWKEVIHT